MYRYYRMTTAMACKILLERSICMSFRSTIKRPWLAPGRGGAAMGGESGHAETQQRHGPAGTTGLLPD
jgi:hypothetical protein